MKTVLQVYWASDLVGRLSLDEDRRFEFTYDQQWLAGKNLPLSYSMPARPEMYVDRISRPFFSNLLPEAEIRRALILKLGLSQGNDFDLLKEIGGECSGALSLWPGKAPLPNDGAYDRLEVSKLEEMIEAMPERPLIIGPDADGYRLSLAGAQPKIPIFLKDDQLYLPRGGFSSTHIVKPPSAQFKNIVLNEAFCMGLGDLAGLEVPKFFILGGTIKSFCIVRYDREWVESDLVSRLHQEDFCQALSVLPDAKYEKEGGPTLKRCFELVANWSANPAVDRNRLLRWVVFNHLIGNADAHAKNLSFLYREAEARLSPFYDLLCTRIYGQLSSTAAMSIGGEKNIDLVSKLNWERFATDVSINKRYVYEIVREVAHSLIREIDSGRLKAAINSVYGENGFLDVLGVEIKKRCTKALARLSAV